jgi:hypothetical protein
LNFFDDPQRFPYVGIRLQHESQNRLGDHMVFRGSIRGKWFGLLRFLAASPSDVGAQGEHDESEFQGANPGRMIVRRERRALQVQARSVGEAHGFVKVLTVPGKDRILGVTVVGEHAGDLIAEFVLAMKHGPGRNQVPATIHIYPTLAGANKYAAGV